MDKTQSSGPPARVRRQRLLGDKVPEDLHYFRVDRHTFTIHIGGDPSHQGPSSELDYEEPGVEYMMADRFEINLRLLTSIDPNRPILIIMASCGGSYVDGMKMFGAILTCPNPVTVLATKWARSMTSIIPLAADRFLIRPPTRYMIHRGKYGFYGTDHEAETDGIERYIQQEQMIRIYIARLREQGKYRRWSEQKIRELLEEKMRQNVDTWFSADEAKQWGFADAVFVGDESTLLAREVNTARRESMMSVLRRPVNVEVRIS